jgi:predicted DsbA family dithiol-disulfide isomerase
VTVVLVEIWSDVVCPWCYIGKRRFEAAAARFEHADELEVVWRSFELDPDAPPERTGDTVGHLARKYGVTREQAQAMEDNVARTAAKAGLEYHLDRARRGNTFDAHRLLHLADDRGVQGALKERLLRAYFTEGEPIGDAEALTRLAGESGLDPDEVATVLAGDDYAEAVRRDERLATGLGVTGVPFFVFGRASAVGGAQSPDVLLEAIEHAWDALPPGASVVSEQSAREQA